MTWRPQISGIHTRSALLSTKCHFIRIHKGLAAKPPKHSGIVLLTWYQNQWLHFLVWVINPYFESMLLLNGVIVENSEKHSTASYLVAISRKCIFFLVFFLQKKKKRQERVSITWTFIVTRWFCIEYSYQSSKAVHCRFLRRFYIAQANTWDWIHPMDHKLHWNYNCITNSQESHTFDDTSYTIFVVAFFLPLSLSLFLSPSLQTISIFSSYSSSPLF